MQAIVDAAVTATNPVTQQVINTAAADVPSQRDGGATAAGESPAGDLIADSQRVYAHTDLAFVNTGSVRAGLLAGRSPTVTCSRCSRSRTTTWTRSA